MIFSYILLSCQVSIIVSSWWSSCCPSFCLQWWWTLRVGQIIRQPQYPKSLPLWVCICVALIKELTRKDECAETMACQFQVTLQVLSRILFLPSATKAAKLSPSNQSSRNSRRGKKMSSQGKCLLSCCCCSCEDDSNHKTEMSHSQSSTNQTRRLLGCSELTDQSSQRGIPNGGHYEQLHSSSSFGSVLGDIEVCLKRIEDCIGSDRATRSEQNRILWQWKCVATVLDRLFFVIYIILNILSLALFFPRPKSMFWGQGDWWTQLLWYRRVIRWLWLIYISNNALSIISISVDKDKSSHDDISDYVMVSSQLMPERLSSWVLCSAQWLRVHLH